MENFDFKKYLAEGTLLKENMNKINTVDELEKYLKELLNYYVDDTIDVAGSDLDWDGNGSNMGISKEELIKDFSDYIMSEIPYLNKE